jgi:predicted DNA-binding protein (UPF0251 family)
VIFKPAGVPARSLPEVVLTLDEFEAIRLADGEGIYQEEAAAEMGISRQTFGRIVDSARAKVAKVLVEGLALRIEKGEVEIADQRVFECVDCGHIWQVPFGTGRPGGCMSCQSTNFRRGEGMVERRRGGRGCGRRQRGRARSDRQEGDPTQDPAIRPIAERTVSADNTGDAEEPETTTGDDSGSQE